jgi:hypothetical protein
MVLHRASSARTQRAWSAEDPQSSRNPKRRLLRPKEWLPMAPASPRLPSMANCLSLLQTMAHREGTWERINRAVRERLRVRLNREIHSQVPEWWIPRVGQDHCGGRRTARLRRRQEDQGHSKRHLLVDTEGFVLKAKVHTVDCIDIELRVGRCMYAGSNKPISETASVRHALRVNHTEIRCIDCSS